MFSKTYVGVIVIILGLLGWSSLVTESEISTAVDYITQIVGIALAIYGRYKAGGVSVLGVKK